MQCARNNSVCVGVSINCKGNIIRQVLDYTFVFIGYLAQINHIRYYKWEYCTYMGREWKNYTVLAALYMTLGWDLAIARFQPRPCGQPGSYAPIFWRNFFFGFFLSKILLAKIFFPNIVMAKILFVKIFSLKIFQAKIFSAKMFEAKIFFLTLPQSDSPTNMPYLFSATH